MTLEYTASLEESELENEVYKIMTAKFPGLSEEDGRRIASESVERIRSEGEAAFQKGLVELGVQYAIPLYEAAGSDAKRKAWD